MILKVPFNQTYSMTVCRSETDSGSLSPAHLAPPLRELLPAEQQKAQQHLSQAVRGLPQPFGFQVQCQALAFSVQGLCVSLTV